MELVYCIKNAMIDKDGNWLYDGNYILILEDGLPYYTVEERNKRNQRFEKVKEDSISLMDGLIPEPSLSKQKIDELVNKIIKLENIQLINHNTKDISYLNFII